MGNLSVSLFDFAIILKQCCAHKQLLEKKRHHGYELQYKAPENRVCGQEGIRIRQGGLGKALEGFGVCIMGKEGHSRSWENGGKAGCSKSPKPFLHS